MRRCVMSLKKHSLMNRVFQSQNEASRDYELHVDYGCRFEWHTKRRRRYGNFWMSNSDFCTHLSINLSYHVKIPPPFPPIFWHFLTFKNKRFVFLEAAKVRLADLLSLHETRETVENFTILSWKTWFYCCWSTTVAEFQPHKNFLGVWIKWKVFVLGSTFEKVEAWKLE